MSVCMLIVGQPGVAIEKKPQLTVALCSVSPLVEFVCLFICDTLTFHFFSWISWVNDFRLPLIMAINLMRHIFFLNQ